MRALILSDIHGNLPALEAVLARPHDRVICLGDVVGYGPEPGACLRILREEKAIMIPGNHDLAWSHGIPPRCRPAFESLAASIASVTKGQLSHADLTYLGALPLTRSVHWGEVRCLLVHATPSDPLYRYLGPELEAWHQEMAECAAAWAVVGHTHLQFDLELGAKRVLNPGSVGQPKDGDPRAAYALLEGGHLRLERVEYEVERTVQALGGIGAPGEAVDVLAELLRTARVPPGASEAHTRS